MKFGVLGNAKIGRDQLIPAMQQAEYSLVHIGTRNTKILPDDAYEDRVKVGRYEDVLNDDEVEAVYIPLPNHLHAEWSLSLIHI